MNISNCPFCGEKPIAENTIQDGYVRCRPCGVTLSRRNGRSGGGLVLAIAMWNTRANSPKADHP